MADVSASHRDVAGSAPSDLVGSKQERMFMKILFVHEVNYLRKPIFEMHEFPEYLAERGHKVGFVQFPEGESKDSLKTFPWKQEIRGRVIKDSKLTLYSPKTNSSGLLGRLMAAVKFRTEFTRIIQDFSPDLVVSFSVPTSGWQALRVSKKANIAYLFRALDVSHKIRKSLLSRLILKAEKYIYRNADWVSANNPAMLEYCIHRGAEATKSSVELPPINLSHFSCKPGWRAETRNKLTIPEDAKVIIYIGSFFYFSGLPYLIRSFAKEKLENQFLILVGGGEQDAELRGLVKRLNLDNSVIFTGFVSFDELPKFLSAADVAVNPMLPSLVSNAAFPNKIIQYLAASLPVVSTRLKGIEATFPISPAIYLAASPTRIHSAVNELLASKALDMMAEEARRLVGSKFSATGAVDHFERLCLKVSKV
jgi:glycosyltransferase involved in cell wall biosynthesis